MGHRARRDTRTSGARHRTRSGPSPEGPGPARTGRALVGDVRDRPAAGGLTG